jgi:hypothetical protein
MSNVTLAYHCCLGNANLVYTIIRKRQVFFALSNLATDTPTITKLSSKNTSPAAAAAAAATTTAGGAGTTAKKNVDHTTSQKNTIFQANIRSTIDDEPSLNKEISPQSPIDSLGITTNAMIITLAETPCKYNHRRIRRYF